MDISAPWQLVKDKLENWLETLIVMLPNLVIGLLVIVLFFFLAKLAKKISKKVFRRILKTESAQRLLGNIIFTIVLLTGVFITLELLQLSKAVTTLLAGAGILGLAISFAFQDIVSNFVSGLFIVTVKPFHVNDIVETNGYFGRISKINLRNTEVETFQGQVVLIPNRKVFENPITNFTKTGLRRIDLEVGVSYGDDLEKVQKVTTETIQKIPEVLKDKGIKLMFKEFGGSSINFKVTFWVKYQSDSTDYVPALNKAIMGLKSAYDENGIMIPYPIRTLDFGIKGGKNLSEMIETQPKKEKNN